MLRQLWNDDSGAIITVEWLMLTAVILGGVGTALVGLRNKMTQSIDNLGDMVVIDQASVQVVRPQPAPAQQTQQQTQNVYLQNYNYITPNP